ncbi:hypothetical protein SLEP1_g7994 [Rubroshorea leprosula]|uniref:GAG-pre-integrase domain-containing protein n=1 Tax=Rubroshorea leprosula TaxID=152421 RepID=A0AAV5I9G0_9ROSI|nr:hypothetical protein SLEP1_g7994 [Rubroshorea leprosula]
MTSFERIVTHPATATVAKEVIEQPNVNIESLKQVILNLFNAYTALSIAPGTKPWTHGQNNFLEPVARWGVCFNSTMHIPDNKMDTPSFPNDQFIQTLLCAIELESLQIPYQQIFQVCAATNISPLHLWHSRLEHTSVGKFRPLISRGLLGSVPNESGHHVAQGTVHLVFIGSADQPADLFTKAHFPGRFRTLLFPNSSWFHHNHLEFEEGC